MTQVNSDYPGGVILSQTVELSNAQIIALPSTRPNLIPAPGPGLLILPVSLYLKFRSAGGYSNFGIGNSLKLQFPSPSNTSFGMQSGAEIMLSSSFNAGFFAPVVMEFAGLDLASGNKPLQLVFDNAGSGNLTGGNAANALLAEVFYSIVNAV